MRLVNKYTRLTLFVKYGKTGRLNFLDKLSNFPIFSFYLKMENPRNSSKDMKSL